MPQKEIFDVTVRKVAETDKAVLVTDGNKTVWIPKSQCELEPNKDGSTFTLTAPVWVLEDRGLV